MNANNYLASALSIQKTQQEAGLEANLRASGESLNNDVSRVVGTTVTEGGASFHYNVSGPQRSDVKDTIQPGTEVFSAIRSRTGWPQTVHQMTEDSVVTIPGIGEMELATALATGFVSRKADGTYVRGPAYDAPEAQPEETHPDLQEETVDAPVEAQLTELVQATDGGTQLAALSEIAATGEISDRVMGQLASQAGIEPKQLAAKIEPIREAFEVQAMKTIEAEGVPVEEVLEWAYEERPEAMQQAIYRHGAARTTAGYKELAREWLLTADKHSPEMILNAKLGEGVRIHQDGRGKIVVTGPDGATYEWRSAVRSGLIRVRAG